MNCVMFSWSSIDLRNAYKTPVSQIVPSDRSEYTYISMPGSGVFFYDGDNGVHDRSHLKSEAWLVSSVDVC